MIKDLALKQAVGKHHALGQQLLYKFLGPRRIILFKSRLI